MEGCTGHAAREQSRPRCLCAHTQEPFTHLEMGCGTTSERHSPTIRQTQMDYKKTQPLLPAPAWLTGRVGNNRASTVDVDICRQSRGRGTHTALKRCMHHCPSIRRGNCGSSSQDPPNHLCICIFHSAENRWHSEGVG